MEVDVAVPDLPHGSLWPRLDALAGNATNADAVSVARSARPALATSDGPLAPSAHSVPVPHPLFLLLGLRLEPHDHQKGVSQQREGDEAIPGRPPPHFILIQAHFSFRLLKALFDRPA